LKAVLARQPDFNIIGELRRFRGREKGHEITSGCSHNGRPYAVQRFAGHDGYNAGAAGDKILILTVSETEADLVESVKAGARGYLLKGMDADELVAAVRTVAAGARSSLRQLRQIAG